MLYHIDRRILAEMASNNTMTVLGFTFDPSDPAVIIEYSLANILANSLIPLPLAGSMTAIGTLLFGMLSGMVINTVTAVIGAEISLLFVRHACRPCLERRLGRFHAKYKALDAALTSQGAQIALLIRLAPVAPMVLTNILLSLTSISQFTYLWTCAIGIVPANLPYAYAAQVGVSIANEFPPKDPFMLIMTVVGLIASIAIAWKIGVIANRVLRRHGFGDGEGEADQERGIESAADDNDESSAAPTPQRGGGAGGSGGGDVEMTSCGGDGDAPAGAPNSKKGLLSKGGRQDRKFKTLKEEEEDPDL